MAYNMHDDRGVVIIYLFCYAAHITFAFVLSDSFVAAQL